MRRSRCAAADPDAAERYRAAAVGRPTAIVAGLLAAGRLAGAVVEGRPGGRAAACSRTTRDLAEGLLALYEATFDERWFETARALMDRVLARFADPAGGFFDTADDHERLVTRPKDVQDNAVPSGNAMAARVLLRLAAWTGEGAYRDAAERAMRTVVPFVARYPTGFAQWLGGDGPRARARHRGGDRRASRTTRPTAALLAEVRRGYRPNQVVSVAADPRASVVPLLARPRRARRTPDRVCLPRLRLPPAGHRRRWLPHAARGDRMSDDEGEIRPATDEDRAKALDCLRCGSVLRAEGPIDLRVGGHSGGWSVLFGGWADVNEALMKLRVFSCPKCGHVEFRVPIV